MDETTTSSIAELSSGSPSVAESTISVITGSSKFKKKPAVLSTWQKRTATSRDFKSEATAEFKRPDESVYMEAWSHENVARELDLHRLALGKKAINRFQSLAEKKYGSVRNMLRSVRIISIHIWINMIIIIHLYFSFKKIKMI